MNAGIRLDSGWEKKKGKDYAERRKYNGRNLERKKGKLRGA